MREEVRDMSKPTWGDYRYRQPRN